MKRQMMAMVLTVTSAMTDEAAKAPVDAIAKPRQHAVNRHRPAQVPLTGESVCTKTVRDRFEEQNMSSRDGYFYHFDP